MATRLSGYAKRVSSGCLLSGVKRTLRLHREMSANADLARPFPNAILVTPVRCVLGGHETTGIYRPYWWGCGNVAACGAGAAANAAGRWFAADGNSRLSQHRCV